MSAVLRGSCFGLCGAVALLGMAALAARETGPETALSLPFPHAGEAHGGWSGIDVSPDGTRFWAVSDRGMRSEGALRRTADGRLMRVDAAAPERLPGLSREPAGTVPDAEGLDIAPSNGAAYVSFEGTARVRRYDGAWRRSWAVPDVPAAQDLPRNRGLEAVARDLAGRLYTLPERPPRFGAPFPLYRYEEPPSGPPRWARAAGLSSDATWLAVGADFGPDGALYLLERRFGIVGFASRVRRFDLERARPEATLAGEIVFASPVGRFGNLEGLGIWADAQGRLRAVMIADDNGNAFQRSEIVEVGLGRLSLASGAPGQ
ncbi:MAG: esterase-like activity of phytase family protein [Pseudomonadota bacterium]